MKLLTMLMSLFISFSVMGQTKTTYMIYGHVADMDNRTPLNSAWVYLFDSNMTLIL